MKQKKPIPTEPAFVGETFSFCGSGGIRTPGTVDPYVSLANWWFQPLTHTSKLYASFCKAVQRYVFFQYGQQKCEVFYPKRLERLCFLPICALSPMVFSLLHASLEMESESGVCVLKCAGKWVIHHSDCG